MSQGPGSWSQGPGPRAQGPSAHGPAALGPLHAMTAETFCSSKHDFRIFYVLCFRIPCLQGLWGELKNFVLFDFSRPALLIPYSQGFSRAKRPVFLILQVGCSRCHAHSFFFGAQKIVSSGELDAFKRRYATSHPK